MPYIFISHSTKDNDFSRFLARYLEKAGFDVWVDFDDIEPGERWIKAIQDGIESCAAMVVVMSRIARDSEWVEREALLAMDLKKPIHTALIEDMPVPLHLINRQYTDFRTNHEESAQRLADALKDLDLHSVAPRKLPGKLPPMPTEDNFFEYLEQLPGGDNNALVARDLYHWGLENADTVEFGGKITPGLHIRVQIGSDEITVFSVWGYPRQPAAQVQMMYIRQYEPYDDYDLRQSTLASLSRLMDDPFIEDKADRRPTLPLTEALDTAEKLEAFKQVMQEIIDNLRGV